ncbi:SDR family oxidoreductase [Alcanivorax marinus]|uniref:sulfoacetaldehyde reductase (NADPH) n=1 Tax=Alloalcanivorax marinus TaxID=1177169 RepID=A0A9Q3UNW4_9GAMM|nr:SDR family oxidoreductase [Alloalcanivorax marinus]MCC4310437.1 SDR family oxidoreductase [Alloalcanivorax marinus]MCU5785564.1 short-chain dehydrogenase/reductase SDR [Alloalcanivorax marinus]
MSTQNAKVILITGASSGIGEATARVLAQAGHTVLLGARRTDRLETLAQRIKQDGGNAKAYALDVASRDNFKQVVADATAEFGAIDVLVNNAGLMPLAPMSALKADEWDRMIDVNIKGVLNGIQAVLTAMEERGGHIINTASIAAHNVFPTAAVYCGTKFAVHAISDGLRMETQNVRVTTISPGVVESELARTTTDAGTKAWLEDFRKVALKPEAIANAIAYAIAQPDDVNVDEMIVQPTAAH